MKNAFIMASMILFSFQSAYSAECDEVENSVEVCDGVAYTAYTVTCRVEDGNGNIAIHAITKEYGKSAAYANCAAQFADQEGSKQ
jgi:hypothetical protein